MTNREQESAVSVNPDDWASESLEELSDLDVEYSDEQKQQFEERIHLQSMTTRAPDKIPLYKQFITKFWKVMSIITLSVYQYTKNRYSHFRSFIHSLSLQENSGELTVEPFRKTEVDKVKLIITGPHGRAVDYLQSDSQKLANLMGYCNCSSPNELNGSSIPLLRKTENISVYGVPRNLSSANVFIFNIITRLKHICSSNKGSHGVNLLLITSAFFTIVFGASFVTGTFLWEVFFNISDVSLLTRGFVGSILLFVGSVFLWAVREQLVTPETYNFYS